MSHGIYTWIHCDFCRYGNVILSCSRMWYVYPYPSWLGDGVKVTNGSYGVRWWVCCVLWREAGAAWKIQETRWKWSHGSLWDEYPRPVDYPHKSPVMQTKLYGRFAWNLRLIVMIAICHLFQPTAGKSMSIPTKNNVAMLWCEWI